MDKNKTISYMIPCRNCLVLPICISLYKINSPHCSVRNMYYRCCFMRSFIRGYRGSDHGGVKQYIDSYKVDLVLAYYDKLKGKKDEDTM